MTDDDFDAYGILRITLNAEDFILEAAYRALARHFHPDGKTPNSVRMAEINRAYDLVRHPSGASGTTASTTFDRWAPARPASRRAWPPRRSADACRHRPMAPPRRGQGPLMTVDFGRYQGWTLKDLAKHDPDYLRFLSRHSSGVRYRNQIAQLLPDERRPPRAAAGSTDPPTTR